MQFLILPHNEEYTVLDGLLNDNLKDCIPELKELDFFN